MRIIPQRNKLVSAAARAPYGRGMIPSHITGPLRVRPAALSWRKRGQLRGVDALLLGVAANPVAGDPRFVPTHPVASAKRLFISIAPPRGGDPVLQRFRKGMGVGV